MKIFYVALKYDYGDAKRGYGFEHYNFYDSLVKMDSGRHKILYFPFDEVISEAGRDGMNKKLLDVVYKERPDLCFFLLFTDEIKQETIKEITEKSGAITFNWFADDHWRFDNFSKHWAPLFHWVSTTDSKAPEKYYRIGYKNVIKTQWACNHFLYKPTTNNQQPITYQYDVSFVGQPHSNRRGIAEKLAENGINIECWGKGWSNGRISQKKMIEIFSASKINLNLSKSSNYLNIKSIARIFLSKRSDGKIIFNNPKSWLDNFKSLLGHQREQIKGRNFEIPGCRGFLLTGSADNLTDYYKDGKEIVIFKDNKDMIEKIKYYSAYENEREKIANAGYERTLKDHTYEKRFNEIFKIIGKL